MRTALSLATLTLCLTLSPAAQAQEAVLPDPALTPGVVRTANTSEICASGTHGLRHWSWERDDRIITEYGLPAGPHPDHEIDHLIPLGLGGSDDDANLWPEPRRSIEPVWSEGRPRMEAS
jgi:hypothetical protein